MIQVFDFDGTLVHLHVDWHGLRKEITSRFWPAKVEHEMSLADSYNSIFSSGMPSQKAALLDLIKDYEQPDGTSSYTAITSMIRHVATLKEKYFIVSNNLHATIESVLQELSLIDLCAGIIGLDDTLCGKPSTAPFELLKQITNKKDPQEYTFIGDSKTDELFASNVGMRFVAVKELL